MWQSRKTHLMLSLGRGIMIRGQKAWILSGNFFACLECLDGRSRPRVDRSSYGNFNKSLPSRQTVQPTNAVIAFHRKPVTFVGEKTFHIHVFLGKMYNAHWIKDVCMNLSLDSHWRSNYQTSWWHKSMTNHTMNPWHFDFIAFRTESTRKRCKIHAFFS